MEDELKNIDSIILHWRESSEQNYATMQNLIKTNEYSWALFIGHLVVEKLIKALYVKKLHQHPVFKHDLLWLIRKIDIEMPSNYDEWLDEVTTLRPLRSRILGTVIANKVKQSQHIDPEYSG